MKALENREDIGTLVRTFYQRVRADDLLGPIFNSTIQSEDAWERHIETLTDFWQANIFFVSNYRGNPIEVHQKVDREQNHGIGQQHFDRWLEMWTSTVDSLFTGDKAHLAKTRAQNMAQMMFLKIQMVRQQA